MTLTKSILLSTSVLFLINAAPKQQTADESRLSRSQLVEINHRGQQTKIVLNANVTNEPLLNTNIKKSIRIVNNDIEKQEFLDVAGHNLREIRKVFESRGFDLPNEFFTDFIVIKNFTHGIKEFKPADLLKTKMNDKDHHSFYWYAVIPKDVKVTDIFVQRDWFDKGVGTHGQLRFKLNSPIVLIPQDKKIADLAGARIDDLTTQPWHDQFMAGQKSSIVIPGDLVYSLFALRYEGGPDDWSFVTGIGGAFANTYTISSISHNVVYLATSDYVEQHALIEPETRGTKTFNTVLERSDKFKEKNIYHLIFNSCITEMNAALSAYDVTETSFNSYRFVELLKDHFQNKDGEDISLNQEFGTIVQTKTVHPKVEEFKAIVTSKELDEKITDIALQLVPMTYKELDQVMKIVKSVQAPVSGQAISKEQLEQLLSEQKQTVPSNLRGLDQAQLTEIILKLVNDQRIMQTFEVLKQRL